MSGGTTTAAGQREMRVLAPAELRLKRQETKTRLEGYAAKFNVRSHDFGGWVEEIRRGAFARTIKEDDIEMVYDHGLSGGITLMGRTKNKTLRLAEDSTGLHFEDDLPNTTAARDLIELVERGDVAEMSFAFIPRHPGGEEWHQEGILCVRTLIDVRLFDVSPVVRGQYPNTELALRSRDEWRRSQAAPGADVMRLARLRLAEAES